MYSSDAQRRAARYLQKFGASAPRAALHTLTETMQPRSREETRRLSTAFSLDSLAQAEARDTSSLAVSSEGWMPSSPTKLLRRLTLRGTASNAVEAELTSSADPGAAPSSPSRQITRLFGRSSAPPTSPTRLRSKAPPWLSTAGGGRTPGVDTDVEPQRSTSPMKRLRELRQQLGRSGKLTETAAAADAASRFYVGTPEARVARPMPAESRLAEQVAARVTPALAGKRLDGTVARATAARLGASPPWRPTVEVVAAVEPNYHPHFVRPPSTAAVSTPWAASKQQAAVAAAAAVAAPPPAAVRSLGASAAARRNTCQTYDEERNALKQRRLDGVRRAALAKPPPTKPTMRASEPSAVTAALASLARDNQGSTSHKNKLGAYRDVLVSAAATAIDELGKLGGQDVVQKAAAAATALDIDALVECFAEADADMSGQIEEDEWPTALAAMHRRWPNEPHTVAEVAGSGFSGTHERRTEAQVIFRQLDLDGDGKVSFSEFVLHRQRQHWVRLRAKKALSTRSEGQLAAERLVTAKLHSNITQISQLQTAESLRGWGG